MRTIPPGFERLRLPRDSETYIEFGAVTFVVTYSSDRVKIARDDDNFVLIEQKSQHVAYKAQILGGFVLAETVHGEVSYAHYLLVDWEEENTAPELVFNLPPSMVRRTYPKGHGIELGIDDVARLQVLYSDGVEAVFERQANDGFKFTFSTGFYGSFWKDQDGYYTLRFKGDCLKPSEDAYRSQSKFIVSRSKYSGHLMLILQDAATVFLS